jgi:uncharacterized protein (DUF736 family)
LLLTKITKIQIIRLKLTSWNITANFPIAMKLIFISGQSLPSWSRRAKALLSPCLREYLSVKLDDATFPAPIYASLVAVEGTQEFTLIWSRRNAD